MGGSNKRAQVGQLFTGDNIPRCILPSWKHRSMDHRKQDARHNSPKDIVSGAFEKAYLV